MKPPRDFHGKNTIRKLFNWFFGNTVHLANLECKYPT